MIRGHAAARPRDAAILTQDSTLDWASYDARSDALAQRLVELGLGPGERVAVLLPDGPEVHVAYVAAEKAGLVSVGIGPRAGLREIEHLLRLTGAAALLSERSHQGEDLVARVSAWCAEGLPVRHHLLSPLDAGEAAGSSELAGRALDPDDLFLLNSTSGTTGMPKCVRHTQRRWLAFHDLAVRAGGLTGEDVFASLVPSPFGSGIWPAHVTPTLLAAPVALLPGFTPEAALALIEQRRVSVLAAVTTQFIMLLNSPAFASADLRSLRVLFTGGEPVPYERAREFEERSGARLLQFYGSNETGAISGTRVDDPREKRLRTAGRVIPEMNVRLFDEQGRDVTAPGRGQPGAKGPTLSDGYWGDDAANAKLVRDDGWMLLGDVVEIDADGYLRVVGRTDDFIIRGGKNISAPGVEQEVATHPAVALAAAVGVPDPVFGERVCVYVELRPGEEALTLEELVAHLSARAVSKELLPERLVVLDELPRGSGGKIAKQRLRDDAVRRAAGP